MPATAKKILRTAKKILREKNTFIIPPLWGMRRLKLMEDVFDVLQNSTDAEVADTTFDDVVETLQIILWRYDHRVKEGKKAAIRRVPGRPVQLWFNKKEKNADPNIDDL